MFELRQIIRKLRYFGGAAYVLNFLFWRLVGECLPLPVILLAVIITVFVTLAVFYRLTDLPSEKLDSSFLCLEEEEKRNEMRVGGLYSPVTYVVFLVCVPMIYLYCKIRAWLDGRNPLAAEIAQTKAQIEIVQDDLKRVISDPHQRELSKQLCELEQFYWGELRRLRQYPRTSAQVIKSYEYDEGVRQAEERVCLAEAHKRARQEIEETIPSQITS